MTVLPTNNPFFTILFESCKELSDLISSNYFEYCFDNSFITNELDYCKFLNDDDRDIPSIRRNIGVSLGLSKERIVSQKLNNGKVSNLIIINSEICKQIDLNQSELCAVIAHELGHIFNKYQEKPIPTLLDKNETDMAQVFHDIQKTKRENILYKEVYADNFAVKLGLKKSLVSGMQKYIKFYTFCNVELFQNRISIICSDEA